MSQHVTGSSLHAESIVNKHPVGLVMCYRVAVEQTIPGWWCLHCHFPTSVRRPGHQ